MIKHNNIKAELEINNKQMLVSETEGKDRGIISYTAPGGKTLMSIQKNIGFKTWQRAGNEISSDCYKKILKSKTDILGKEILSQKDDPSYEKIVDLLPPLGNPYTFLGEKEYHYRPLPRIEWDGSISGCLGFSFGGFQPWKFHSGFESPYESTAQESNIKHSLLDGYLPAIQFIYQNEKDKIGWEEIAFAKSYEECDNSMLVFIRIKLKNLKNSSRKETFSIFFTPFIRAHNNYPFIEDQTSFSVQDFYPVHRGDSIAIEPEWLWVSKENDWQKGKVYPQGTLEFDYNFRGNEEKTLYMIFAYPRYLKHGSFKRLVPELNFYRAMFEMKKDWDAFIEKGLRIETPESRVNNACKATLIQSFLKVIKKISLHPLTNQ